MEHPFIPELTLESQGIRKLSLLYRAIDHPVRLSIIQLLHEHKTISVLEICVKLEMNKDVISQHLGVLRRSGLVHSTRHSRFQYYSFDYKLWKNIRFLPDPS